MSSKVSRQIPRCPRCRILSPRHPSPSICFHCPTVHASGTGTSTPRSDDQLGIPCLMHNDHTDESKRKRESNQNYVQRSSAYLYKLYKEVACFAWNDNNMLQILHYYISADIRKLFLHQLTCLQLSSCFTASVFIVALSRSI